MKNADARRAFADALRQRVEPILRELEGGAVAPEDQFALDRLFETLAEIELIADNAGETAFDEFAACVPASSAIH